MKKMLALVFLLWSMVANVSVVLAHSSGSLIVRAGAATVVPNDDSSTISGISGTGVDVGNSTQLGLTVSYMLTDYIGLGLLAATPFKHDIDADGLGGIGVHNVGSVKHLPPTLTLQYFPLSPESRVQPYIGVGLNYTVFFSEDVSGNLENVLGDSDMNLDSSWGLAGEVGVDIRIKDNWHVNFAIWHVDIDTKATLDTTVLGELEVDVDIDPFVYMIGVGYQF